MLHAKRTSGHSLASLIRSISVLPPTQLWCISLLPTGGSVSACAGTCRGLSGGECPVQYSSQLAPGTERHGPVTIPGAPRFPSPDTRVVTLPTVDKSGRMKFCARVTNVDARWRTTGDVEKHRGELLAPARGPGNRLPLCFLFLLRSSRVASRLCDASPDSEAGGTQADVGSHTSVPLPSAPPCARHRHRRRRLCAGHGGVH